MVRLLALDVGNTSTKVGIFENDQLVKNFRRRSAGITKDSFERLLRSSKAAYAIISSTKHLSSAVQRLCRERSDCYLVDHKLALPFENHYETPKTLGPDRIAGVAGALAYFPKENSLVIDAGTCITYDYVKRGKIYEGGNISPGVHMRLRAMNAQTDTLPLVRSFDDLPIAGTSTRTALQVGAARGAVHEMEGFIAQYQRRARKVNIVLTGGDAAFFDNHLKTKIFVSPNLVLIGLAKLLRYNVS